jgi:hypothetical protein
METFLGVRPNWKFVLGDCPLFDIPFWEFNWYFFPVSVPFVYPLGVYVKRGPPPLGFRPAYLTGLSPVCWQGRSSGEGEKAAAKALALEWF